MQRDEELVFDLRQAFARAERKARRRRLRKIIISTVLGLGWLALMFAIALGWLS
jgi:hypothetical protein